MDSTNNQSIVPILLGQNTFNQLQFSSNGSLVIRGPTTCTTSSGEGRKTSLKANTTSEFLGGTKGEDNFEYEGFVGWNW